MNTHVTKGERRDNNIPSRNPFPPNQLTRKRYLALIMKETFIYQPNHLFYTQEPLLGYKPGGYHPVNLGDNFKDGRYQVHHKLGWGKYSTTWLAYDKRYVIAPYCLHYHH